jgi:hypothetical protein
LSAVYIDDPRMRVDTPQNSGMRHPVAMDIANEFSNTAQKSNVFFAFDSCTDVRHRLSWIEPSKSTSSS